MTPPRSPKSASELYESAPCGLLSTAENGTITRVNRTFATWMGYRPDELVGAKRLQDLLTMGCKIFHQTHWMPLLQMQGSVSEVQLEFVRRDGSALAALVNAASDPGEGCCDVAVFVATDRRKYERELLLARKRAEELLESEREAQAALDVARARLRLAIDSAQLLVWDIDPDTGAPRYEPGIEQLLGLAPGAVVTAAAYQACIDPADREAEQAALAAALSPDGSGHYRAEYRLLGSDHKERVVSSSGRAFFDSSRRLAAFAGVLQDVTPWRLAEKVLREQERDAQQRAILAEQLIGIVSHDLRTPLHAVLLGANSLVTSGVTAVQARTLTRVVSAANRANRLIADLLDFTQARLGGGLPLARVELDLHAVVADCVEELKLAWSGRMIEHVRRGDGVTFGDPDRLAQVVTNLASNALTYGTPERPVIVTSVVSTREAEIQVHNQGPPIPPELLPHIFEPLRRGEHQVKLGSRSVGLGLYIVRQIADAHGGRVTVTSGADGTTFAVRAPRDAREPSAPSAR